jgi:hypothetical protein
MSADADASTFDATVLSMDDAARSWFIIDAGTVIWTANMQMYCYDFTAEDRETKIQQFKAWFLDSYNAQGWEETDASLTEGCDWRLYQTYLIASAFRPGDKNLLNANRYALMVEGGLIPSC